jgi:hypothetical protein
LLFERGWVVSEEWVLDEEWRIEREETTYARGSGRERRGVSATRSDWLLTSVVESAMPLEPCGACGDPLEQGSKSQRTRCEKRRERISVSRHACILVVCLPWCCGTVPDSIIIYRDDARCLWTHIIDRPNTRPA